MIRATRLIRCFSIGLLATALLSHPVEAANTQHGYIPGRFIVKVRSLGRLAAIRSALASPSRFESVLPVSMNQNLKETGEFEKYFVYNTPDTAVTVSDVIQTLGSDNVDMVEQDQYLEFYGMPTDSLFPNQWYLRNIGQNYLGIQRVEGYFNDLLITKSGAPEIDIDLTSVYVSPPAETSKVVVAIVDTGTDPHHPELQGRFWKNPGEIASNGIDDDHNGYIDDTLGYDVSGDVPAYHDVVGDNDPTDEDGHGTHLAGIVAANADEVGIVGVAPWAQIMSVKIRPNGFLSIGTAGVLYAIDNGARVINISWGTPFEALILKDALDLARKNGVFVCIAAGNSGDNSRANPAAFDSSFTVAAGDSRGKLTWFSTWGPFVDIVAPGEDILSLRARGTDMYAAGGEPDLRIIDSLYYLADGTSMASPVVAGAAALVLSFRPDLSLQQLEFALRMGARDMVDPLNRGDSLVGADSISGYGYLDVQRSLNLVTHGGVACFSPQPFNRLSGAVPIKIASIAGYAGGWQLEYSVGALSESWIPLDSGLSVPMDSVAHVFNRSDLNGLINFRLADDFGNQRTITIRYINADQLELTSPTPGDTVRYSIPIYGRAFGTGFDSVAVCYRFGTSAQTRLFAGTREYYDTLIFQWNASGLKSGNYTIYLNGYFATGRVVDSASIFVSSSFAAGWPQTLPSRGSQTAITSDLNHDGQREVIAGTFNGLYVFQANGQLLAGFPKFTDKDMRCVPAIYDVDSDGQDEIVCTNDEAIHVIKYNGTEALGWPRKCSTGNLVFGYPTPTIASLVPGQQPVIMIVDTQGKIQAYKLDGTPYFFSLGGEYARFNSGASTGYFFGGNAVAVADITGDDRPEVIATYTGLSPRSGVAVYDGRTGQPAFGRSIAQIIEGQLAYGTVLADLNGDHIPEIITTGQDSAYNRILWVKTVSPNGNGLQDLAGFPIRFPDASGWIGNFPAVADLDLDGSPEIICAFYEYDVGSIYIFRADGSPYRDDLTGRPAGEVFRYPNTFGVPVVADLTGDRHPEIVFRGGHILPGSGPELVFSLDCTGPILPGYPNVTPAKNSVVYSNSYAPLLDDIDKDGLMEMAYLGDAGELYIWDYDASSRGGANVGRFMADNLNSSYYPISSSPTDNPDRPKPLACTFELAQNYPNPFNPATTISFSLPERARATLEVFNILGQRIGTLVDQVLPAGAHRVTFDGNTLASGVYLYRLTAGDFCQVRKMVLVK